MLLAAAYGRGVPLPPRVEPDGGLVEVADRVWVTRHAPLDVTATVVAGQAGVLLVDTLGSATAGRDLLTAVRRLGRGEPVAVVNTHHHVGHAGGNAGLLAGLAGLDRGVPVLAHEAAATAVPAPAGDLRPLSSVTALDLGDRVVEVVHPGRGHTAGDLVVRVPDEDVLVVGDLVAGGAPPAYGPDCWPLEWPATLDLVLQLLGSGVAVPGHGAPLDRDGVEAQRDQIATVAGTVRELAGRGVPVETALTQGEADGSWPWPVERLTEAVRRGYAQLPRSARSLPLA